MNAGVLIFGAVSSLQGMQASAVMVLRSTLDRRLITIDSNTPGTLLAHR